MATNDNMDTNAGAGCEDDRKLFAGGLPQDAKEAQIKEHFGQFGEFETATLKTNTATGRSSKAELCKNTLLEYDKTSEDRTKVVDDESDYFAADTDKWQSNGSRLNKKYAFDLAGKTFVEAGLDIYDPSKDEKLPEILESRKTDQKYGLRASHSLGKRAANAFLALGLALLPTPASGQDDGYDPITNLIR